MAFKRSGVRIPLSPPKNPRLNCYSRINIDDKSTSLNLLGKYFSIHKNEAFPLRSIIILGNIRKNVYEKLSPSVQNGNFFSCINNLRRTILQNSRPLYDQFQTVFSRNSCSLRLLLCLHSSSGSLSLSPCQRHSP